MNNKNVPTDTPVNLCTYHIYSGDYEGKTVVITSPDHCSVCNDSPTWIDVAHLFSSASMWLTQVAKNIDDDELLSETNDRVKHAFVSYLKKVHPNYKAALLEWLKVSE